MFLRPQHWQEPCCTNEKVVLLVFWGWMSAPLAWLGLFMMFLWADHAFWSFFNSVGKHVALLDLVLGTYGTHKATASVFPSSPPRLFSSPSLLPPLCRDVIIPPLSTSDLRASVHSLRAWWVFGDCVAIWAALCRILCGTIHGPRLQMNASIHKYSLSISRSPWCLVVVFSCSLRGEKKAIKIGQKQAGTLVVYLENKKRNNRKWCLQGARSLLEQSQPNFISLDCFFSSFFSLHAIKWRISSQALRFRRFLSATTLSVHVLLKKVHFKTKASFSSKEVEYFSDYISQYIDSGVIFNIYYRLMSNVSTANMLSCPLSIISDMFQLSWLLS